MFKSAFILGCAFCCALITGVSMRMFAGPVGTPAAASALVEAPLPAPAAAVAASPEATTSDSHITALPKAPDGHFWANAVVDEKAVRFLVDTGATTVVLTPADAQRLGFDTTNLSFDRKVITANGETHAAMVNLSSVGIGSSTVRDVQALVVKDGLTSSLLGMSYLGRLSRIEATPSSLILHP
jgi:aspartyl protease family protein